LHTNMAVVLARLGRLSEAQAELETAMRINPGFEPAKKMLAQLKAQAK
jgi:Tfp pilus assembly protein PilF